MGAMATDIAAWLRGLGLERYEPAFRDAEVTGDVLPDLTEADLEKLGLPLGPRKKLLRAIASLGSENGPEAAPTGSTPGARRAAERRQLTVMFADLVGSTALSARLDPEAMREVLRSYQNAVAGEVSRFEGHVAKFMGDGVLAYFGWPRAHEDEAERSVRAGLAIVAAVARLTSGDEALACRIGIATGLVVVGDLVGEGAAQEEAVVGDTPNLAARLQAAAEPGTVVIAAATRHLLGDLFVLREHEPQTFKGFREPAAVFAVLGERLVESRFAARQAGAVAPIVGRDQELALLVERWRMARAGEGQLVLLSGEAGIGKSRITEALVSALAGEPHVTIRYQCSPYHADSPLWPVAQQLGFAAGIAADDPAERRVDKLEALLGLAVDEPGTAAPLLAALLGIDGEARYGRLDLTPQQRRNRTLEALINQLLGLAARRPVLWMVEDAHWIDPTTQELIELALDQVAAAPVLLLVTARPTYTHGFEGHPSVTRLALNRLGRESTAAIMARITRGKALPEDLVSEIAARTDGVPLFIEEMTKAVIESGMLRETLDGFQLEAPLSRLAIPTSLHDSLMARLDRLQPVKEVAQTAAVIGRSFDYRTIAALSPLPGTELADAMHRLVEAELVFCRGTPPDASYAFKHSLVRDAAYESLLKSRRQLLHGRLVDVLDCPPGTSPEILAHHAQEAGLPAKAADQWLEAGQGAMRRSANVEAERHLNKGLAVLQAMPEGAERRRREITLQNTLGVCLMPTRGFGNPDVAGAFSRAAAIAEDEGDTRGLFVALRGKGQYQMISGDLRTAREQAGRILGLAHELDEPGPLIEAHHLAWSALTFTGDFGAARRHAETGIALYDRERDHRLAHAYSGHDPGVCCRSFGSLALWQLGYPDQALSICRDGERLAREVAHPFSVTIALWAAGMLHLLRRDASATLATGESMIAHCREKGFPPFVPMGRIFRGGALAEQGELTAGSAELAAGITGVRTSGTKYTLPLFFAWLGEIWGKGGQLEEAAAALSQGRVMSEATGDQFSLPEFDRIGGELLLARSARDQAGAQDCFERAMQRARAHDAKSLELRAAASLARLWGEQGERRKAYDLLAPIYGWFTEGFDTPDLIEAQALMETLASGPVADTRPRVRRA
jgi:class 3 adenylate cyclase/predicted ATPase